MTGEKSDRVKCTAVGGGEGVAGKSDYVKDKKIESRGLGYQEVEDGSGGGAPSRGP